MTISTLKDPAYTVKLVRDEGGWWVARIAGVKGVHSNGRSIEEAMRRVREALALALDDDDAADRAELVADVRLPPPMKSLLRRQAAARARARREQEESMRLQARAARELTEGLGLSLRVAGTLLGVSHVMASKALRASHGARSARRAASKGRRVSVAGAAPR